MKKLSLLLMAVAFLCPKVTNAQDGKGSINFVPYVGVNYSDFSGDTQEYFYGTSGKVNFMAGARFEFQIAKESAIIADLNYRRLGATADNNHVVEASMLGDIINGYNTLNYVDPNDLYSSDMYNSINNFEDLKKLIYEKGGVGVFSKSTKITLDYISLGFQFKQNVAPGLSARIGIEGSFCISARWHYHSLGCYAYQDENGNMIKSSDHENDDWGDMDKTFETYDLAIPLGLTYDYKNFSLSATYHLPLLKCADEGGYSVRNQALDLTIGYRLPLRKR